MESKPEGLRNSWRKKLRGLVILKLRAGQWSFGIQSGGEDFEGNEVRKKVCST